MQNRNDDPAKGSMELTDAQLMSVAGGDTKTPPPPPPPTHDFQITKKVDVASSNLF